MLLSAIGGALGGATAMTGLITLIYGSCGDCDNHNKPANVGLGLAIAGGTVTALSILVGISLKRSGSLQMERVKERYEPSVPPVPRIVPTVGLLLDKDRTGLVAGFTF